MAKHIAVDTVADVVLTAGDSEIEIGTARSARVELKQRDAFDLDDVLSTLSITVFFDTHENRFEVPAQVITDLVRTMPTATRGGGR